MAMLLADLPPNETAVLASGMTTASRDAWSTVSVVLTVAHACGIGIRRGKPLSAAVIDEEELQ
jgi:hypothetical protein